MHADGEITETFLLSCCDEILSQNPADVCEASAGFFVCGWIVLHIWRWSAKIILLRL